MEIFNCNGKSLSFDTPKVMAILNLTPDSFYERSRIVNEYSAIQMAEKFIKEGADILDIGGISTRPGSKPPDVETEASRIISPLKTIRKEFPDIIISVDTYRSEVSAKVLDLGADIINDISAGNMDPYILEVVSKYNVPYVYMHMQGTPETMQLNPQYKDPVADVLKYLLNKKRYFQSKGINQLICDPGFGFGKTIDDNFKLLNHLDIFNILDLPILVGISRKSMIYKYLHISPDESLTGTTALNFAALMKGVKILRVHDVKETVETIRLFTKMVNSR